MSVKSPAAGFRAVGRSGGVRGWVVCRRRGRAGSGSSGRL